MGGVDGTLPGSVVVVELGAVVDEGADSGSVVVVVGAAVVVVVDAAFSFSSAALALAAAAASSLTVVNSSPISLSYLSHG